MYISDKKTNQKAYSDMLGELEIDLPLLNEVLTGSESKWYTQKTGRELDIPGLKMIETVNGTLVATIQYGDYCI